MPELCALDSRIRTTDSIRHRFVAAVFFPAAILTALGLTVADSCCAAGHQAKSAADADDDDDSNVDLQLSALVVPARFSSKYKDTDILKFLVEVRGLLLEGFKNKGDSAEAAKKHFEAANKLPVIDPRAAYAYGIVLLGQNSKSAAALEQFRVAARGKKVPYLPALQAQAWTHLSRGDHAESQAALLELAKRLEDSQQSWPAAEDKENAAEWLGRTVGFLTGPGRIAAQSKQIDKLAGDIGNVLSAERKQAYDRGKKATAARYEELKAQAARPEAELAAEANKKPEEIAANAEVAQREAKLIESELATLKKAHDKQLAELAAQVRDNTMKVKTTKPRIPAAEAEIEDLSEPKKHASGKLQGSGNRRSSTQTLQKVIRNENAGEKKIRESQLASAQKRLENIKAALDDAEKAIAEARQQREEEQAAFRKETFPRRQALLAAQQKAAELKARAREAEQGLTAEKVKARVTSLDSYVPFYSELERDRLLASLKSPAQ